MIYVLIVVGNINGGVVTTTQEFTTYENCKIAAEFVVKSSQHIRGSNFGTAHLATTWVKK